MNLENQLLEKFQVEELEKRYEFAWLKPFDPSEVGAIIKLVSAENVAEATGTEADFELKNVFSSCLLATANFFIIKYVKNE